MALTAPLTKLEAVNEMLYDMGERPVSSITGNARLDVTRAEATLERISRDIQSRSWWFNREERTLVPNGSGEYIIPVNIISVDLVTGVAQGNSPVSPITGKGPNFVVRNGKLVNTVDQVSTGYTDTLTVDVTVLLVFEDLPSTVKSYVYAAASSINVLRAIGATDLVTELKVQAITLLDLMKGEEIDQQDLRSTQSPRHFQLINNR